MSELKEMLTPAQWASLARICELLADNIETYLPSSEAQSELAQLRYIQRLADAQYPDLLRDWVNEMDERFGKPGRDTSEFDIRSPGAGQWHLIVGGRKKADEG